MLIEAVGALFAFGIFVFVITHWKYATQYFKNRSLLLEARQALMSEMERIHNKEEDLNVERKNIRKELDDDLELKRMAALYEIELKHKAALSEIEIHNLKNKAEEQRLRNIELDLELQKQAKLSDFLPEIEAEKLKAEQLERIANIEVEKKRALLELDVQNKMQESYANSQEYRQARLEEDRKKADLKILEAKTKLELEAQSLQGKIEANKKYVKEFMRQEDFNGTHNSSYRIRTPIPPFPNI